MKYIYALLISLFLPTVVFAQSVPVSWLRNTASGFLTPLNINDSVGIGTSTPYSKLSIQYGTILANTLSPILTLGGTHAAASGGTSIDFTVNGNTNSMSRIGSVISGTSGELALYTTTQYSTVSPTEKLRITGSGNVGIGSTTPLSQLTVQKTLTSETDYPALALSRNDTSNTLGDSLGDIDFWSNDISTDGPGIGSRIRGVAEGAAGRSYGVSLWTRSGDSGTPISEKMRVTSTGNVGIGTTTPNAKLSIYSGAAGAYTVNAAADELVLENNSSGGMTIATPNASTGNIFFSSPSRQIGSQLSWNYSNLLMTLGTGVTGGQVQFLAGNATEAMRINASGNVGIGTTTPWTRLAVTGSTTIAGGPLIVLGSANTPISADTDWYRQFGIFRKDINDYSFMTLENRNGGSNASVDFLFNNDRTTALSYYWDLGFNSSAFNNPAFGLLNVPNAAYEYVTDGPKISATATTSSAGYFDFITGGLSSSRLRITSTGNVGIGTTTPRNKLEIVGTTFAGASLCDTSNDILCLQNIVSTAINIITPSTLSGALNFSDGTRAVGRFTYDHSTDAMTFHTNSTEKMRIASDGNVGIGTTTPGNLLSLYKNTGSLISSIQSNGIAWAGLKISDLADPMTYWNSGSNFRWGVTTANDGVTGFSEYMRISSTGNLGIGTTSPRSTLSVGSVNDATASYAQIDSVNGAPTAGDCDTDLERGRMIIDYSNNRFYICNGATRGWDYSALTD